MLNDQKKHAAPFFSQLTQQVISKQGVRWVAALVLTITFLLTAQSVAHSQADFTALLEDIAPAVVRIETPTFGTGSGFVVEYRNADNEPAWGIVTACHVVEGAPRSLQNSDSLGTVIVHFDAWRSGVAMRAAVVKCDKITDSALLMPIDDAGNIITLPEHFHAQADAQNDISLNRFPRLWMGDSDELGLFESVFVLGYPSPFSEFNVSLAHISGRLSLPYVQPDEGAPELLVGYIIYRGVAGDEEIGLLDIIDVQSSSALPLDALSRLAQNVMNAGHSLLLLAGTGLTGSDLVWDVLGVDNGFVQLQARLMEIGGLFIPTIDISPRLDQFGSLSFSREFLKIDAPVAPGHSGGPVLTIHGQVIGKIELGSSEQAGANFAAPVNEFRQVLFGNSE
jgi:S1-C subfamily serine protease